MDNGRESNAQGLPTEPPHPNYGSLSRARRQQGRGPQLTSKPYRRLSHHRGYGPPAVEYTTGSTDRSPPRMRRVPGFSTHPIKAGRPSRPSALRGSDVASCRAQRVASPPAPPRGLAPECGLHHLVAGREVLRSGETPLAPPRPTGDGGRPDPEVQGRPSFW